SLGGCSPNRGILVVFQVLLQTGHYGRAVSGRNRKFSQRLSRCNPDIWQLILLQALAQGSDDESAIGLCDRKASQDPDRGGVVAGRPPMLPRQQMAQSGKHQTSLCLRNVKMSQRVDHRPLEREGRSVFQPLTHVRDDARALSLRKAECPQSFQDLAQNVTVIFVFQAL